MKFILFVAEHKGHSEELIKIACGEVEHNCSKSSQGRGTLEKENYPIFGVI